MNKSSLGIGLAVLAVVLSGWAFWRQPVSAPAPVQKLAGTSPDIASPYLQWGGVNHWSTRGALATGTTTPCSILSPNATSTLVSSALRVGTATTSATTWTLAKATSPYATTTKLGVFSLAGAAMGTMVASTSAPSTGLTSLIVDDVQVFAPNTYLVWGVAGVIYNAQSTIDFGGTCQAEFTQI